MPAAHTAPFAEFAARRRNVADSLPQHKVHAIIVTALPNIRYLSGFTGSNAALVLAEESATLFTDPRYTIQSAAESDCVVRTAKGPLTTAISAFIARKKWNRIGFERNRISYAAYADLVQAVPKDRLLLPLSGAIERLRMVKSQAEIELIRRSVFTNSKAYENTLRRLKASSTEAAIAAELEYQMRRLGAEKPAFDTIVASGAHSALPHASPRIQAIETNRLLLIDMGSFQAGYASDMTRTIHLGKAAGKARKLYNAVLESQLSAIDAVREGATAGSVDRAARQVLRRHGLDKAFIHSTGHGLGLEIHEAPRLGRRDDTLLEAGMVITIEPGAYERGFGGVRIEDTVVVTHNGCEVLTPTSKDFVSL